MRQRQARAGRWTRTVVLVATAGGLAGCAGADVLDQAQKLQIYNHQVSLTKNPIDQALAACPEKLPKPETDCVRRGLVEARVSPAELIALVPGCQAGRLCTYDYTTRDRLGFIEATSAVFVVKWRVTFDLRQPSWTAANLPITVADRDAFDVPQPKPPPPIPKATPLVPQDPPKEPPAKPGPA